MLKRPFGRSPALHTAVRRNTPAANKSSTDDSVVINIRSSKFSPKEREHLHQIISTAKEAVHAVRYPADATDNDRNSVAVLTDAGVISAEMTVKEKRRIIGALWKTVENLLNGHGTTTRWVNPLNHLLGVVRTRS